MQPRFYLLKRSFFLRVYLNKTFLPKLFIFLSRVRCDRIRVYKQMEIDLGYEIGYNWKRNLNTRIENLTRFHDRSHGIIELPHFYRSSNPNPFIFVQISFPPPSYLLLNEIFRSPPSTASRRNSFWRGWKAWWSETRR